MVKRMNTRSIKHHPSDNLLAEYSAGSLDFALCISVSAHLHYCQVCQYRMQEFEDIGGQLLSEQKSVKVDDSVFEALIQKLDNPSIISSNANAPKSRFGLPPVVEKLIPSKRALRWRRVSPALKQANLKSGQKQYEVCLHKIGKGGKVAEHDHRGLEVTLVLQGSFSDDEGVYQAGDFLVKEAGDVHRPCAAQNQDCLCLTVVAAPVLLTGLFTRWLNPLLSFRPD